MAKHTPGPWTPEDDANARLIAAAPDLLEALKIVTKELKIYGSVQGWNNDLALALSIADRTINKAEGR